MTVQSFLGLGVISECIYISNISEDITLKHLKYLIIGLSTRDNLNCMFAHTLLDMSYAVRISL